MPHRPPPQLAGTGGRCHKITPERRRTQITVVPYWSVNRTPIVLKLASSKKLGYCLKILQPKKVGLLHTWTGAKSSLTKRLRNIADVSARLRGKTFRFLFVRVSEVFFAALR